MHAGISCIEHAGGNRCLSLAVEKSLTDYDATSRLAFSTDSGGSSNSDDGEVICVGLTGGAEGGAGVEVWNEGNGKKKSCGIVHGLIEKSIDENGRGVGRKGDWIDYIPIFDDGHWGMVAVVKDGPSRAVI